MEGGAMLETLRPDLFRPVRDAELRWPERLYGELRHESAPRRQDPILHREEGDGDDEADEQS
jgi:hypothetical protein